MATVDLRPTNRAVVSLTDSGLVLRFPDEVAGCSVSFSKDGEHVCDFAVDEGATAPLGPALLAEGFGVYEGTCTDSIGLPQSFTIEIVERHYCTLDQILDRGMDSGISPRQAKKTEDDAFEARARATETIDEACGRSFVKRVAKTRIFASAGCFYPLAWADAHVEDAHFQQVCDCGVVALQGGVYELAYTHGTDTLPADISQATALLAATYLTPTNIPSRATGQSTDAGFLRFTVAGVDGATGIPEVDSVIQRRKRERFGVI